MNIKGPYTYPCMLHVNNAAVRQMLEKFGYCDYWKDASNEKNQLLVACSDNAIFGCKEVISRYSAMLLNNPYIDYLKENYIDCVDNVSLFLALAAHRNDTDIHQWFIPDESYNLEGRGPVLCEYDSWEDDFYTWTMDDDIFPYMYKKADKDDLMKIFE